MIFSVVDWAADDRDAKEGCSLTTGTTVPGSVSIVMLVDRPFWALWGGTRQ